MTDADAKRLFDSVDKILSFAADDTGIPKRGAVKRRLVSKAEVEKYVTGSLAKEEFAQRFAEEELSLKKLGLLPRNFNLKEFLVKSTGQEIAGYYDPETKTISLLNWVPYDQQEPILAHELTHALQDQNYDLPRWMKAGEKAAGIGAGDGALARKAVVEGQAMVTYIDYMLRPAGRTLEETPELIYQMEDTAVRATVDSQLMHQAPMILREAGTFAYKQGLIFEGELLHKGGKEMAFAGVFQRPPRNSHEVLQPEAYIQREKIPTMSIPDMQQVLQNEYQAFDSGGVGELDVRALMKQYGERKVADDLSTAWQGGAYVTFRHKANIPANAADVALLYVSRWKTHEAAEHFARFYASTVPQRYQNATVQTMPACSEKHCPVGVAQYATEEGPVIVELWQDNTVTVSESFNSEIAAKLHNALRDGMDTEHAENLPQPEIVERLLQIPAFEMFANEVGTQFASAISREACR